MFAVRVLLLRSSDFWDSFLEITRRVAARSFDDASMHLIDGAG